MDCAPQVCKTCKLRKKGCDKILPQCWYCYKRGLICKYDQPQPNNRSGAEMDKISILVPPGSALQDRVWPEWSPEQNQRSPSSLFDLFSSPGLAKESGNLPDLLDSHICRIKEATGLSILDVSDRYFSDFHRWLPIVSPQLFYETLVRYQNGSPPPDFSILCATMYLITFHPPSEASDESTNLDSIYLTVKMLCSFLQAATSTSTPLVQAGLLISAYEYASQRPDTAYTSLGTSINMAHILGLNLRPKDVKMRSELKALEDWNVWWGIVVLERAIISQIHLRTRGPLTTYPELDSPLPSDLKIGEESPYLSPFDKTRATAINNDGVSSFGRHAQAVYMLDQALQLLIGAPEVGILTRELKRLDGEMRAFLMVLLDESKEIRRVHCGAIGSMITSLFLLHQTIIAESMDCRLDDIRTQLADSSRAALETVVKITVDNSREHLDYIAPYNIDALPPSCVYNIQAAIVHMRDTSIFRSGDEYEKHLQTLLDLHRMLRDRWRMVPSRDVLGDCGQGVKEQ